ncbi:hypothetical protein [Lysinibacter cavernae]|uniref:hypothetical protein n=1 Tax=Lysinibacter cavernae TaxID=1640652 RepID=UPI0036197C22
MTSKTHEQSDQTVAERIAEICARAEAATAGPWTTSERDHFNYEVDDDGICSRCVHYPESPLKEVFIQNDQTWHSHYEPAHHVMSGDTCITGNYDYEIGGILEDNDTIFIAHARSDIPFLLRELNAANEKLSKIQKLTGLGADTVPAMAFDVTPVMLAAER